MAFSIKFSIIQLPQNLSLTFQKVLRKNFILFKIIQLNFSYRPNTVTMNHFQNLIQISIDNIAWSRLLNNTCSFITVNIWSKLLWNCRYLVVLFLSIFLSPCKIAWWNGWEISKKNWKFFTSRTLVRPWMWCIYYWPLNYNACETFTGRK
jgi:hypothetical protein